MRRVETLIVGGGPAGSTCAWELGRRGRECAILERQALPKRKLCAGWITPKVVRDLRLRERGYPHGLLRLSRFRVYLGRSPLKLEWDSEQYSIRRVELDNWLLARCGAPVVRHDARAIVRTNEGFEIDGLWRCRYLVGAGGTSCPVRRALFPPDGGRLVLTQEIEFPASPRAADCVLFYPYAGLAGYAWLVPKQGAVNVGFGGVDAQFRGNIKTYWSGFARLLVRRRLLDREPPLPGSHPYYVGSRQKAVRRGNAFIVGDAAGLATADLGEGIGPAVESGLFAARAICGEAEYEASAIGARTLGGVAGRLMAGFVARA